jgi:thiol-disulfide isomerase/thioredoxin
MTAPARRVRLPWMPLGVLAILTAFYLIASPTAQPTTGVNGAAAKPDVVRRAADFRFEDINPRSATHGQTLELSSLYAERGVVLRMVASWCNICREELPEVQRLVADAELPIVLVAADENGSPESMLIVAERNGLTSPILFVPEAELDAFERDYDYRILPATYVIDPDGAILAAREGKMGAGELAGEISASLGL